MGKIYYQKKDGEILYFNTEDLEEIVEIEIASLYYYGEYYDTKELDNMYEKTIDEIKNLELGKEIKCGEAYFGVLDKKNLIVFPDTKTII